MSDRPTPEERWDALCESFCNHVVPDENGMREPSEHCGLCIIAEIRAAEQAARDERDREWSQDCDRLVEMGKRVARRELIEMLVLTDTISASRGRELHCMSAEEQRNYWCQVRDDARRETWNRSIVDAQQFSFVYSVSMSNAEVMRWTEYIERLRAARDEDLEKS